MMLRSSSVGYIDMPSTPNRRTTNVKIMTKAISTPISDSPQANSSLVKRGSNSFLPSFRVSSIIHAPLSIRKNVQLHYSRSGWLTQVPVRLSRAKTKTESVILLPVSAMLVLVRSFLRSWQPCLRGRAGSTAWHGEPYRCGQPRTLQRSGSVPGRSSRRLRRKRCGER